MQKPNYENKNGGPEFKPWSIKSFPVKLRRRVASDAAKEGTTIPHKLEEIVESHYDGKKK